MADTKKTFSFQLLDGSQLTNKWRVNVAGVDLAQFNRNPVALYDHDDWKPPIGAWQNVRVENGILLADFAPDYEDTDPEVQRIIGKIERGIIKMASVGLVDLVCSEDEAGVMVHSCRLREVSIVAIGKNHNALRLYDRDGKELNLSDEGLSLSDRIEFQTPIKTSMNKELLTALNLSDKATDEQAVEAVKLLLADKKKSDNKVTELQGKLDAADKAAAEKAAAEKAAKKAEALTLTDAGIKNGSIDASTKQGWLEAFDRDFDGTKQLLCGVSKPVGSVRAIIEKGKEGALELADKSWDELDKAGKLEELKLKDVDTFKAKFKEKFKKEYAG